jgi:dolichol-phosphate mannosyltransferase
VLRGSRVFVVIPAFDEAARIGPTVAGVPAFVDGVIVVDDASRDDTAAVAESVRDPRVTVLRRATNGGVGRAITDGYAVARHGGADVVAVMAGDGQMDPADLERVVSPVIDGHADYVKGNRLGHERIADMPLARRLGTTVLGKLTARAVGVPGLGDSQCGYTAISGAMLDVLPLSRVWPRYGYPNDLLSEVTLAAGRVVEVSVRPVYAGEASGLRARHVVVICGLLARAAVRRTMAPAPRFRPAR